MTKKTIKKTKTMTIEEHPQRTVPETFDLWDSDYISVNWEQQSQQSQRDKSARMLWFLRQKCAYVMIFATRMLWVLRQKCVHTLWFLQHKCAYVVSSTTTIVFLVFLVQTPVFPKVGLCTLCQIHQKILGRGLWISISCLRIGHITSIQIWSCLCISTSKSRVIFLESGATAGEARSDFGRAISLPIT